MSSKLEIGLIAVGTGAVLAGCYLLRKWCASGGQKQNVPIETVPVPVPVAEIHVKVEGDSKPSTEGPVERNASVVKTDPLTNNGCSRKQTKPIYRALEEYNLDILINGRKMTMVIDSGCHYTIIKKSDWIALGKPPLEPGPEIYCCNTGASFRVKGQFAATIQLDGRLFQHPVLVSRLSDGIDNLLGRISFPSLHLDWNSILHCKSDGIRHFLTRSEKQDQLALQMKQNCSKAFMIDLKLEGVKTCMMLDTGAMISQVSKEYWQVLGKPPLKPTRIELVDAVDNPVPLEGRCLVNVEYQGEKAVLSLFVTSDDTGDFIIGTSWFKHLRFDFNTIFQDIQFESSSDHS